MEVEKRGDYIYIYCLNVKASDEMVPQRENEDCLLLRAVSMAA